VSLLYLIEQQKKFTTGVVSVRSALVRIVFGHVYPRLDVNVSKHLNHLLKSPFCVHPKTGKVCIPMDPEDAEGFDVDAVPHVVQLHEELNAAAEQGDLSKSNWQSTSLRPSIEYFKTFVTTLMNANRAENPRSYAKQAANHAQQEVGQWQTHTLARDDRCTVDDLHAASHRFSRSLSRFDCVCHSQRRATGDSCLAHALALLFSCSNRRLSSFHRILSLFKNYVSLYLIDD